MFCGSRCDRLAVWVNASMMRLLRLIWMRSQTLYGLFFSGTAENLQRFAGMPKALTRTFRLPFFASDSTCRPCVFPIWRHSEDGGTRHGLMTGTLVLGPNKQQEIHDVAHG